MVKVLVASHGRTDNEGTVLVMKGAVTVGLEIYL